MSCPISFPPSSMIAKIQFDVASRRPSHIDMDGDPKEIILFMEHFGLSPARKKSHPIKNKGLVNHVRQLQKEGFFNAPRTNWEVRDELYNRGLVPKEYTGSMMGAQMRFVYVNDGTLGRQEVPSKKQGPNTVKYFSKGTAASQNEDTTPAA